MYCSTCGTKLDDKALFCSNCGTKVVVETPVAETPVVEAPVVEAPVVEAPVVEAPVTEEVKVEEPVEEPAAPVEETPVVETPVVEAPVVEEVKVEEPVEEPVTPVVEAPVVETPVVEEVKVEKQAEPVAPASKKAEKPKKKKGKGCLVAVIIVLVVIVLLIALILIAVLGFFGLKAMNSGAKYNNTYDYSGYSAYYGNYQGTSVVTETRGASTLSDFYLYSAQAIDEDNLLTDQTSYPFAISIYEADYSEGAWDMAVYLGDQFGYVSITSLDFVSNDEYAKGGAYLGDILPDSTGSFSIVSNDISENLNDANSLGGRMLGISTDADGQYCVLLKNGRIDKNGNISGTLVITLKYADMANAYQETVEFNAVRN